MPHPYRNAIGGNASSRSWQLCQKLCISPWCCGAFFPVATRAAVPKKELAGKQADILSTSEVEVMLENPKKMVAASCL
jgi:hypothetical protein